MARHLAYIVELPFEIKVGYWYDYVLGKTTDNIRIQILKPDHPKRARVIARNPHIKGHDGVLGSLGYFHKMNLIGLSADQTEPPPPVRFLGPTKWDWRNWK